MNIPNTTFALTNWIQISPEEHRGETGTSFWRTIDAGNIRVRMVEYLPGFKADHYCSRGHILLVLDGELIIKLKESKEYRLTSGQSFHVGDDEANPHLAYSERGAKVFIVD